MKPITAKDFIGQIITLAERLDTKDREIEAIAAAKSDMMDRLEALEAPKTMSLTKIGDEKYDALIDDLARKDEIITSLFTLVTTLQDELNEIKAHVFAQDHRLGRSISFDRMSR